MHVAVLGTAPSALRHLGLVSAPDGLARALADVAGGHTVTTDVLRGDVLPDSWSTGIGRLAAAVVDRHGGADVVHALDVVAAAAALAARRETGTPVVVRAQPVAAGPGPAAVLWPLVVRAADAVLTPTSDDADAATHHGVRRGRLVQCLDGALVADRACAGAPPMQDEIGCDDYVLVLSGVPGDSRVLLDLVRATRTAGLRLVVASPDDRDAGRRARLVEAVAAAGDAGRVECVGRLEGADLVTTVDRSAAVVATRSDPSSALSALVAMHRARAVVAVDGAAARAAVVDGLTGRVVDLRSAGLGHAVEEVGSSRFRRLAWGVAGRDRVESCYAAGLVREQVERAWHLAVA
jgi:glycosyltransferase involved in cell wall biosynthesis